MYRRNQSYMKICWKDIFTPRCSFSYCISSSKVLGPILTTENSSNKYLLRRSNTRVFYQKGAYDYDYDLNCEITTSWCLFILAVPHQIGKMVTAGHHYSFACTEYLQILYSWQQEVWKSNGPFRNKRTNKQTHKPSLCQLNFAGPNLNIVYRVEADRLVHSDKCKLLEALQFSHTALR